MSEFDVKLNMWELTRHLWSKYVWVSDEYKLLRNKWCFLCDDLYPALPRLRSNEGESPLTFDILDTQILEMDEIFRRYFNFRRDEPESRKKFRLRPRRKIKHYSFLEKRVSDLSAYLGLLKLAFYQRTVSVEIPHITLGYPHSPERTIGNELIYVAADKVADAYMKCLNMPKHPSLPRWDGFITYVPPITDELSIGAFCDIRPYGLVRLSLSERHKHALFPYLLLAHEIGHVPLITSRTRKMRNTFYRLAVSIINEIGEDFSIKLKGRNIKCVREQKCNFYSNEAKRLEGFWIGVLNQLFADTFGVKLGGPTVIEVLLNETLFSPFVLESLKYMSNEILLRCWAAVEYMPKVSTGKRRSHIINTRLKKIASQYTKEEGLERPCFECLEQLGRFIGQKVKEAGSRKFNSFVQKGMKFRINAQEEKEITASMLDGRSCVEIDPRKILHCCFVASQKTAVFEKGTDKRVCFASVIHSLAYNTYFNCEAERAPSTNSNTLGMHAKI